MKTALLYRRTMVSSTVILGSMMLCSCAQYTAIRQPAPFKPVASVVGAKRVAVAGELGSPVISEEQNGHLLDTYKYVDGGGKNNGASKTARVVLYTAGDVFTIFLDQILTWPVETYGFAGTSHVVTVEFAKGDDGFWQATEVRDTVPVTQDKKSSFTNAPPSELKRPRQP